MDPLELHPRLAADTHVLGRLPEGLLLLHHNASVPWLILVPPGTAAELYELEEPLRSHVLDRVDDLARFVKRHFACARVNVAAIGNIVPQLHLHVVGRSPRDPAWPGVVWGAALPAAEWTPELRAEIVAGLSASMDLEPVSP